MLKVNIFCSLLNRVYQQSRSLRSDHELPWALKSNQKYSGAIMSMGQWHCECSSMLMAACLMKAHDRLWVIFPQWHHAHACWWLFISAYECSWAPMNTQNFGSIEPRALMSTNEWSWALLSTHELSWALRSTFGTQEHWRVPWALLNAYVGSGRHAHELLWGLMRTQKCSWVLKSDHKCKWRHSTTLKSTHVHSWALMGTNEQPWELMNMAP